MIWEPVLWSDAFRPADRELARQIPDARAKHFWDPGKILSKEILHASWTREYAVRGGPSGVVWDWVACFPAGVRWDSEFPEPAEQGFPVVDAAQDVRGWLRRL